MNNGIMFNADAPTMDGHWYNPGSEDNFTVKDTFFEDGQYKVLTTDGRLLGYDQIQYYVKVDKPIIKKKDNPVPSNILNEIDENNDMLLEEDLNIINGKIGNIYSPPTETKQDTDIVVLDKALNKNTLPEIQVSIKWKDFPKSEINMVCSLLDIPMEKIISWYTDKMNISELKCSLNDALKNYIIKNIKEETTQKKPSTKNNKK